MTYAAMIVHVDIEKNSDKRSRLAVELADRFSAALIGIAGWAPRPALVAEGIVIEAEMTELEMEEMQARLDEAGKKKLFGQLEALDLFDALSRDPAIHLDMNLQVGDMQLCNNLTMLHSRTDYEDWPEPERKRHMLRLWLVFRERRPLAPTFPAHNGYGQNQIAEVALLSAGC